MKWNMAICAGVICAAAGTAGSAQGFWEYEDWRVWVEEVDTGEDLRRTCTAMTGGDGDPSVSIAFSNGDAGPPTVFPSVVIREHAPRHYQTGMRDGQAAYVRFDDEDTVEGVVRGYLDEGVFEVAEITYHHPVSQWVLEAMRRNYQMDTVVEHKVYFSAFLNGFSAAYLKAAVECGFDGSGVLID
ncbi:hypothetical protein [Litorivita pollutaquae]|nr:hypothetical protein [Litorivita pollutaquae]